MWTQEACLILEWVRKFLFKLFITAVFWTCLISEIFFLEISLNKFHKKNFLLAFLLIFQVTQKAAFIQDSNDHGLRIQTFYLSLFLIDYFFTFQLFHFIQIRHHIMSNIQGEKSRYILFSCKDSIFLASFLKPPWFRERHPVSESFL